MSINIVVENYLTINKDLIGQQINLTKSNAILLFLEICRIKQSEIKAVIRNHFNDIEDDLSFNKKRLNNIFSKSIIKDNIKLYNIINDMQNGVFFIDQTGNITKIIESVFFNQNNGNIYIVFNEINFFKFFIKNNKNFTKLALDYMKNIKSKNVSMLLLYIMKYNDFKNVFISRKKLLFLFGMKNDIKESHLNQSIKRVLNQLKNIEFLSSINIDKNKNNNYNIKFISFDFNIIKNNQIKNKSNNGSQEFIDDNKYSDSELSIYMED